MVIFRARNEYRRVELLGDEGVELFLRQEVELLPDEEVECPLGGKEAASPLGEGVEFLPGEVGGCLHPLCLGV
jgi:hypothetical protein